ncbi:hypothetical protein MMC22_005892 [Lobaria immixta]|nr:hypothetical protein [Lobaria immixta]
MLKSILRPLVAGLAFQQLAHAVPSSLSTRTTIGTLANFDDIPEVVPGTTLQPINTYKNVFWRAFVLATAGSDGVIRSLPGTGGVAGSSPNKRITLFSFWWGAALKTQEAVASVPQNAQLTVTGYDAGDNAVAVDRFDYDVTGVSQQMVFAKVNTTFTNLKHVDFFLDRIAAATLIAALIDDVDFSVTQ